MATKRNPTGKTARRRTASKGPARKAARRSTGRRSSRKGSKSKSLYRPLLAVSILAALVLAAVLLADFVLEPAPPVRTAPARAAVPAARPGPPPAEVTLPKTEYEVFPPPESPPPTPTTPEPATIPPDLTPPGQDLPRVTIIIDDLGYDKRMAARFISLDAALTFAVLPHSPFQKKIADLAHTRGRETMLHLPMEPKEYPSVNPGPGTLLSTMGPDELLRQLEDNLAAVPHIKGVNNHMGSKLTTASDQINQVFTILKKRGLYFIDSRTTSSSVCRPSAKLLQVPFAQRDIFIDHLQTPEFIRKQLKELVRVARRNGQAVGIAHPHRVTYRILKEMLPEIQKEVLVVPASEIVAKVG